LAVLFFWFREKIVPLPKITGRWYFEMRTVRTSYNPYQNMILRYVSMLWREGNRVEGTVEKIYENSSTGERDYVGTNRTRGKVEGYIEKNYFGKDRLFLHVIEEGHGRESTNFYELIADSETVMNGESENVVKRISQQDKNQDFWNEVIIFTSKDENLTKGHIKYLESRLTSISIEADRYKIENGNNPTASMLPRADKDAMEEFIHNLRIVLGTLGHRVLEPVKVVKQQAPDVPLKLNLSQFTFSFSIRGLHATGQQTDDGFVLFKGADVSSKTSKSMPGKILAIREKWIADGTLQPEGENYRLTKDSIFSSSSYAAAIVAGTSRSGPQSWIDEQGRSLKAVEEILLSET
jgi:hypothetical protein